MPAQACKPDIDALIASATLAQCRAALLAVTNSTWDSMQPLGPTDFAMDGSDHDVTVARHAALQDLSTEIDDAMRTALSAVPEGARDLT
ncbi:hypothetical protein ABZV92_19950 [Streptomyces rubiginosohelvolus]|uniref:hypothetical protein n=1 Tax=Streptomyces rubiginosohelvolus TaxID=67362 RepID=UPI0033A65D5D